MYLSLTETNFFYMYSLHRTWRLVATMSVALVGSYPVPFCTIAATLTVIKTEVC